MKMETIKGKYIDWLFLAFIGGIIAAILCSCTTGKPELYKINGITRVHTPKKLLGITYHTVVEEVKTKEQKLEDLEVQEAKNDLITEERQKAAAFWFGVGFFIIAAGSVFAGYIINGWKFFGGMAAISGTFGVVAWSFENVVPYLKYPAYAIGGAFVLWSMWKLKSFDLLEKLKKSPEGRII